MAYYSRGSDYLPYLRRQTDDWDLALPRSSSFRRPLSTVGRRDGPLLDRDYLASAGNDFRTCGRLESGTFMYPRPPSPGLRRNQMLELEDQLKMYKEELSRREKLIGELQGVSHPHMSQTVSERERCSVCNHGNVPIRSDNDLDILQKKVEDLQLQVQDLETRLKLKDKKIQELKVSCKAAKKKEVARSDGDDSEQESSSSSSSSSSDSSASTPHQSVRNESQHSTPGIAEGLVKENAELKHELMLAKARIEKFDSEHRSSGEKMSQMSAELERLHRHGSESMTALAKERDALLEKQKQLENNIVILTGNLESSQREMKLSRNELEQHMNHCGGLDRQRRQQESLARSTETQLTSFRDCLARILSDDVVRVEPSEGRIKGRVEELMLAVREKTTLVERLERQNRELLEKLKSEVRAADGIRERNLNPEIAELEARLSRAENELMARDEAGDVIQANRDKFWQYLKRLCAALEMDPVTSNLGLDEAVVTILGRVEDIMKRNALLLSKSKSQNHHLQQKLSRLNDQLESKESHMELLRRKIASLEQHLNAGSHTEHERDNEYARNRKMQQLLEKYRHELNGCHTEIRELKSRLLYSTDVQSQAVHGDRELFELESEVEQLEEERFNQAGRIAGLERAVRSTSADLVEKKEVANNTIHALSLELRNTQAALEEVTRRESKLLELRLIVARMLGLDVTSLTVPDYEIISRLEKVVLSSRTNSSAAVALDDAVANLHNGFKAGYHQAAHVLDTPKRRIRSRSLSPLRKWDRRAY